MSPWDPDDDNEPSDQWSKSGSRQLTKREQRILQSVAEEQERLDNAGEEKTPEVVTWAKRHVGLKTALAVIGVLLANAFGIGGIWMSIKAHAQAIDATVAETKATAEQAKADVATLEKKKLADHAELDKTISKVAQAVSDQVEAQKTTNARLDEVTRLLFQLARRSFVDPAPAPPKRSPKEPAP